MPKKKTQSLHNNGLLPRHDSAYVPPAEKDGGLSHVTEPPYSAAFYSQDGFFGGTHSQNLSPAHGGEAEDADQDSESGRGVGLDFAILDSTFLLSQVFPTLFMGTIVQFAQSVTAYIASSAIFGAAAIYLAGGIIFEQKDLKS